MIKDVIPVPGGLWYSTSDVVAPRLFHRTLLQCPKILGLLQVIVVYPLTEALKGTHCTLGFTNSLQSLNLPGPQMETLMSLERALFLEPIDQVSLLVLPPTGCAVLSNSLCLSKSISSFVKWK